MNSLVLCLGDRSPRVAETRIILARLGFLDGFTGEVPGGDTQTWTQEDTYFDEVLEQAVRQFQQQRGIIVDGRITVGTLQALREASYILGARVLRYQDNYLVGDDVSQLQAQLSGLGFDTGKIDGHFGLMTHAAVQEYQRNYALEVDGIVGPETVRALSYLGLRDHAGSLHKVREMESVRSSGPRLSGKRVVIDPALGGENRGYEVQGRFGMVTEEELLWDLAVRIESRMLAAGMQVMLSRQRHKDLSAQARADIANAFEADLFISLKADMYKNEKAGGAASFYFGSLEGHSSLMGERLSGLIQREMCARLPLQNCFNHGRTWEVLRKTAMPAVQVVPGYLSNPHDLEVLNDPFMRDKIAEAVVVAVKRLYLLDQDTHETGTFTFGDLLRSEQEPIAVH